LNFNPSGDFGPAISATYSQFCNFSVIPDVRVSCARRQKSSVIYLFLMRLRACPIISEEGDFSMTIKGRLKRFQPLVWAAALALLVFNAAAGLRAVFADDNFFLPGNLVVSRSVYDNNPANVEVGMTLPPDCVDGNGCVQAVVDGTYPYVWNNVLGDAS